MILKTTIKFRKIKNIIIKSIINMTIKIINTITIIIKIIIIIKINTEETRINKEINIKNKVSIKMLKVNLPTTNTQNPI